MVGHGSEQVLSLLDPALATLHCRRFRYGQTGGARPRSLRPARHRLRPAPITSVRGLFGRNAAASAGGSIVDFDRLPSPATWGPTAWDRQRGDQQRGDQQRGDRQRRDRRRGDQRRVRGPTAWGPNSVGTTGAAGTIGAAGTTGVGTSGAAGTSRGGTSGGGTSGGGAERRGTSLVRKALTLAPIPPYCRSAANSGAGAGGAWNPLQGIKDAVDRFTGRGNAARGPANATDSSAERRRRGLNR